ncbi:hypothetical protein ABIC65_001475 [Sphingomonas trueperi]|uniref:hypothetical protein n=1 Tax=Sphingomonas trueperi TaxID=53317 RepID=UPI00339B4091
MALPRFSGIAPKNWRDVEDGRLVIRELVLVERRARGLHKYHSIPDKLIGSSIQLQNREMPSSKLGMSKPYNRNDPVLTAGMQRANEMIEHATASIKELQLEGEKRDARGAITYNAKLARQRMRNPEGLATIPRAALRHTLRKALLAAECEVQLKQDAMIAAEADLERAIVALAYVRNKAAIFEAADLDKFRAHAEPLTDAVDPEDAELVKYLKALGLTSKALGRIERSRLAETLSQLAAEAASQNNVEVDCEEHGGKNSDSIGVALKADEHGVKTEADGEQTFMNENAQQAVQVGAAEIVAPPAGTSVTERIGTDRGAEADFGGRSANAPDKVVPVMPSQDRRVASEGVSLEGAYPIANDGWELPAAVSVEAAAAFMEVARRFQNGTEDLSDRERRTWGVRWYDGIPEQTLVDALTDHIAEGTESPLAHEYLATLRSDGKTAAEALLCRWSERKMAFEIATSRGWAEERAKLGFPDPPSN